MRKAKPTVDEVWELREQVSALKQENETLRQIAGLPKEATKITYYSSPCPPPPPRSKILSETKCAPNGTRRFSTTTAFYVFEADYIRVAQKHEEAQREVRRLSDELAIKDDMLQTAQRSIQNSHAQLSQRKMAAQFCATAGDVSPVALQNMLTFLSGKKVKK